MKRRGLCFIIGGFFYIAINLFFCSRLLVYADEFEDQVDQITEDLEADYGYISSIDEDKEDPDSVLSDTYTLIKKVDEDMEAGTKGSRSMPVNSYDPSVAWLFDQTYYYKSKTCSLMDSTGRDFYASCYWFPSDSFDENTLQYITTFANYYGYPDPVTITGGYAVAETDKQLTVSNSRARMNTFISNNGWVSEINEIYWWVPDPTPSPDPDPTLTPDPNPTTTPEGDITVNIDPEFKIMVIFVGGLISGLLVGKMLMGFVK